MFLSGNNNLIYAKDIINECKRIISGIELPDNNDYDKCKKNINGCDVNGLLEKVEETKQNLFKIDQEFAGEYLSLLQESIETASIDTSNMTEEEKMQYSIQMSAYARDYNYSLLYMLQKYEENDMLTPELKSQLEYQKAVVEQYAVQDQMAPLTTTSQEYIDLFKKNAEYDKKLISINPNLTEDQKTSFLKQYEINFNSNLDILELNRDIAKKTEELKKLENGTEKYYNKEKEILQLQIDYYENKGELTETEKAKLKELKDYKDLNGLYIDQVENSNFFHSFVYDEYEKAIYNKKKEMGITTEDEDEWHNMSGWERACANTGTFITSTLLGVGSVTEGIIDGTVMLAGGVGSIFGADTKWAEDFVSVSISEDGYDGLVQADFINGVSANTGWHTTGNFVGEVGGTILLQFLPGGTWVSVSAHALNGMGKASESALQSEKTFGEAFGYGAANGIIEGLSAWLLYGKTPKSNKVAEVAGKKVLGKLGGNKVVSLAKTGLTKVGAKNYANNVLKSSLITKFWVAGGKEWAKEFTNLIIDEEIDVKQTFKDSLQSMATTAFNEFVVAPVVDTATKKSSTGKKVDKADKKGQKILKNKAIQEERLKKLHESDSKFAKDTVSAKEQYFKQSGIEDAPLSQYKEKEILNRIRRYDAQIDNTYGRISAWDIIVGKDFVNKFSKKIGTKVYKGEIDKIIGSQPDEDKIIDAINKFGLVEGLEE